MATFTPYAAAKIVNAWLAEDDPEHKALPPQMLYTYCDKGYIAADIIDGKWQVSEEALGEWYAKYRLNKKTKAAKKGTEVVAEADGTVGEW